MASGDYKYSRSRGGYGSSYDYDDEGRGHSKNVYDQFIKGFEASGYKEWWLVAGYPNKDLLDLGNNTTTRFNLHDWCDWRDGDGRTKRIVETKCGKFAWLAFYARFQELKDDERWIKANFMPIISRANQVIYTRERGAREAEKLAKLEEEETQTINDVRMTTGMIQNDLEQVFRWMDRADLLDGDYLESPVAAYMTGYGFGEEYKAKAGITLQLTASLDTSNSLYYNDIAPPALAAFRTLVMSLEQLKLEYPDHLHTAYFKFSGGSDGKYCRQISGTSGLPSSAARTVTQLMLEEYKDSEAYSLFRGEDTWMFTLLEKIESWENKYSDPGAVKVDIIISDAVLEHPNDIRWSNLIQERRDGALQTIILNLMPRDKWHDGAVPKRCLQYPAAADNLAGLLRNILAEAVNVYL